ncbi:MAG TPA: hypothetical protein VM513_19505 [Kofleriaceae bacterium]|jgi:hypothetical protein|nr:hypothetical protein [Kofleriaceae bacterium]
MRGALVSLVLVGCASAGVQPDGGVDPDTRDARDAPDVVPDAAIPDAPSYCGGLGDRFDIADTTTLAGWTERGGDWSVTAMAAHQNELEGVYSHYMTRDTSMQSDGCASVLARFNTASTGMTVQSVGVVLRWTPPDTFIVGLVQDNVGAGQFDTLYIYQYPNFEYLGMMSGAFGTTPRLRLCAAGATVNLGVDANADATYETTLPATTTILGAGLAGVMTHTFSAQPSVDDFCVGQSL